MKHLFLLFIGMFIYLGPTLTFAQDSEDCPAVFDCSPPQHYPILYTPFNPQPTPIAKPGMDLVFQDEFNSCPYNNPKWRFEKRHAGSRGRELTYYNKENCDRNANFEVGYDNEIGSNTLEIKVLRENQIGHSWISTVNGTNYFMEKEYHFTGGMISTDQKFRYGYLEIRAKFPRGKGFFPAIWMWGDYDYPAAGKKLADELDLNEPRGDNESTPIMGTNYHNGTHNWIVDRVDSLHPEATGFDVQLSGGPDQSEAFHVFGMDWREKEVSWYINGRCVRTVREGDPSDITFLDSMRIILNQNLAYYSGLDYFCPFPGALEVDYARFYKRIPGQEFTSFTINAQGNAPLEAFEGLPIVLNALPSYSPDDTYWLKVTQTDASGTQDYGGVDAWLTPEQVKFRDRVDLVGFCQTQGFNLDQAGYYNVTLLAGGANWAPVTKLMEVKECIASVNFSINGVSTSSSQGVSVAESDEIYLVDNSLSCLGEITLEIEDLGLYGPGPHLNLAWPLTSGDMTAFDKFDIRKYMEYRGYPLQYGRTYALRLIAGPASTFPNPPPFPYAEKLFTMLACPGPQNVFNISGERVSGTLNIEAGTYIGMNAKGSFSCSKAFKVRVEQLTLGGVPTGQFVEKSFSVDPLSVNPDDINNIDLRNLCRTNGMQLQTGFKYRVTWMVIDSLGNATVVDHQDIFLELCSNGVHSELIINSRKYIADGAGNLPPSGTGTYPVAIGQGIIMDGTESRSCDGTFFIEVEEKNLLGNLTGYKFSNWFGVEFPLPKEYLHFNLRDLACKYCYVFKHGYTYQVKWVAGGGTWSEEIQNIRFTFDNSDAATTYGSAMNCNGYRGAGSSGTNEEQDHEIELYPNPARNSATLVTALEEPGKSVSIYNLQGQKVYSREFKDQRIELDVTSLKSGVYLIQMHHSKGVINRKISIVK